MSWMQKLCEAYDSGIVCDQSKESVMLVPLGFVRKKVKYHVVLTQEGRFVSADELMAEAQFQEIPSTPQAESRTGDNGAAFPLVEQLKYLVYEDVNLKRFSQYMEQLNAWCGQPDAPDCLRAVYTYLDGHTLLADLESQPNLKLKYYKNAETREGTGEDAKAMVCFSVQMHDSSNDDLWLRTDVKQSWSNYLADKLPSAREFCYVEGKMLPSVENHPKLQGNAKLISAKDSEFPFQYKGRFVDDRSAALVSFDASVRAHNALTWLIARQGMQKYGMIWVVWNTNGAIMKVPIDEVNDFMEEEEDEEDAASGPVIDTFASYAREVNAAACGYGGRLHDYNPDRTNCAVILGLEAATDGRMSVTYYQECTGNKYVERLEDWYIDCCWWRYSRKKKTKEIATPNPDDIAIAVMGIDAVYAAKRDKKCEKSHTKWMRNLQSRILTCIVDKQRLPLDVVRSAFYRVCAPLAFVSGKERQWSRSAWENSVDTACAMIYCFQKRGEGKYCEVFSPELQANSKNADYLYGRLLAVADFMEEKAMDKGRDYPTNAVRLMRQFVQRPFETWPKIHEKLIPSFGKLGSNGKIYQMIIEETEQLFSAAGRYERRELSLEFLQGFSCQRQSLFQKWEHNIKKDEGKVLYELPKRRSELYGCLLAIADAAEREASDGKRTGMTNAMQMMTVFAARPYESWGRLHDKLLPYLEKLGERADYYQWLIENAEMQFLQLERESSVPLDGSYLHGYYCMLRTFYQKTQFSWERPVWKDAKDMRSSLYGQLLGIAERLERRHFIGKAEGIDRRFTNELRFMTVFAQKPADTWENLKVKLGPYQKFAGCCGERDNSMLEQLEVQLQQHGWNTNEPLGSIYLHFYYEERNK
ncbi:type I-C CRISPR-associated protein Cas8c/Csd1 [Lactonifactor longoviformis]|uniref:CRISPR-associated protein, Csd1 family n=3 Tax=Lactonifactor TaxID=420345 RepID=A0A1M4ZAS8_9CLOT|nr:type I-C CRISPR-associated protein Cas8c/Csd1 [Lactonifactor longoviformis]SHF14917.1 CRISPR-associated protein, Csd1 family [Lactonifactor longoviformis DSM 17459]